MLLSLALALSVAADDPKATIEKAIKAHGGADALTKHQGQRMHVRGTIQGGGMELAVSGTILRVAPDKEKTDLTLKAGGMEIPFVAVANGKDYKVTVAGQAQDAPEDRVADSRFSVYAYQLARLTPLLKAPYTLKAGPDAGTVVVEHPDFKPVTLHFDADTGRLVKTVRMGKGEDGDAERVSVFDDFKAVGGLQLPHSIRTTIGGKKQAELTVEKYDLLETVPAGEFGTD